MKTDEDIANNRADWLMDAVACASQDRRFLRGDKAEDVVVTEAIFLNAKKAILVAIEQARGMPDKESS